MTILRTHPHEGTVGTSPASASVENYDILDTPAPTYVAGGVVGSTCLRWDSAQGALDDTPIPAGAEYVGLYIRIPSAPTGDVGVIRVETASGTSAEVGVNTSRQLWIATGFTVAATTTAALTLGSWYRVEYHNAVAGQELRFFDPFDAVTPTETLTAAINGTDPVNRWDFGLVTIALQNGVLDLDQVVLADAWPDLGVPPPASNVKLKVGGAWVDATTKLRIGGVLTGAAETLLFGAAPAGAVIPQTIPFTIGG